jgi:TonB family protein
VANRLVIEIERLAPEPCSLAGPDSILPTYDAPVDDVVCAARAGERRRSRERGGSRDADGRVGGGNVAGCLAARGCADEPPLLHPAAEQAAADPAESRDGSLHHTRRRTRPGPASIDARRSFTTAQTSLDAGGTRADSVPPSPASAPVATEPSKDSVFTEIEVDSTVVRSQLSAAPAYPLELLAKHVEGMALVQYVVDTTGFADTQSFTVIRATDPGFVRAVREALPYMRFSPAKIGAKKVRQLVEQPFTFKISPTLANGAKP